jgi:replicative DNA helicase
MARSISRETFLTARDKDRRELAKDVRHILNGHFWKNYSDAEYEHIRTAIKLYGRYASNIYIQEGVGDITVERIAATVEAHIKEHGAAPVVVLDYLQIIAPDEKDANRTDKQITDKNIVALKRLARDKHLVILAISSFNRENYTEPVSYASFKESGAIEYSSDVLIGLQYEGMDYQTQTNGRGETVPESNPQHIARIRQLTRENDKAAKNGEPITIEVKILKCRNGAKTTKKLYYYPKYNTFTELMDFDDAAASGTDEEEARPTDTGRKRKF